MNARMYPRVSVHLAKQLLESWRVSYSLQIFYSIGDTQAIRIRAFCALHNIYSESCCVTNVNIQCTPATDVILQPYLDIEHASIIYTRSCPVCQFTDHVFSNCHVNKI